MIREGAWRVIVGPPRLRNAIDVDMLNMNAGRQPIHIVPATRPEGGGKGKTIGAIIVGVVLIGAAMRRDRRAGGGVRARRWRCWHDLRHRRPDRRLDGAGRHVGAC